MKKLLILLLGFSLCLAPIRTAEAGKGFSSGGRSYSSGGGKSYTSGSSGRSYSSSGGKSFTSGGSTSSSSPVAKTGGAAATSPAGKTYTSGGNSGRGYSSPAGQTQPAGGATSYTSPAAKGYSSAGSTRASPNVPVAPAPAVRKPTVSYDKLAAAEQKKAESRAAYVKAQEPLKTYKPPKGDPKPIDPRDRQIEQLRSQLDHERWVNRLPREQIFYGNYYTRPMVIYHDPYNSFFWWWLLDRSLEQRSFWAYHHRYDMDDARYQALLAQDAQLQARIAQLESQNVPRDRAYAPPEFRDNSDLMYTDNYVNAVYNPQPAPVANPPTQPSSVAPPSHGGQPRSYSGSSGGSHSRAFGHVVYTIFMILLIAGFIWFAVWLVFYKRWNI